MLNLKKKAIPSSLNGYGVLGTSDTSGDLVFVKETGEVINLTGASSSVYGTEFQFIKDDSINTTSSDAYVQKLRLTTTNLPLGNYRIDWNYQWNHDAQTNDYLGRVRLNDTDELMVHLQEPKDNQGSFGTTGTDQQHVASGFDIRQLSGVNTIDMDYASTLAGAASSIWNVRLSLVRVS